MSLTRRAVSRGGEYRDLADDPRRRGGETKQRMRAGATRSLSKAHKREKYPRICPCCKKRERYGGVFDFAFAQNFPPILSRHEAGKIQRVVNYRI